MLEQEQQTRKNTTNKRLTMMVHTEHWVALIKNEKILLYNFPRALSLDLERLCFHSILQL